MGLLGKGKDSSEGTDAVENIAKRLENVESRVNALDNALQDYEEKVEKSQSTDVKLKEQVDQIQNNLSVKLDDAVELMTQIIDVQQDNIDDIEENRSSLSGFSSTLSDLEDRVESLEQKLQELDEGSSGPGDDVLNLKRRIERLEAEVDSKVSYEKFKDDEKDLEREVSKLRSSMNYLADKFDSDKIRVEEES